MAHTIHLIILLSTVTLLATVRSTPTGNFLDDEYDFDEYPTPVHHSQEELEYENEDRPFIPEHVEYSEDYDFPQEYTDDYSHSRFARQADMITFYEHASHNGHHVNAWPERGVCYRYPGPNDSLSSVDTRGSCIILYENSDCTGRSLTVAPGAGCHFRLSECDFNDIVTSYYKC